MPTFSSKKGQEAGVAASVLVITVLAVGILHFSGESQSPSGQQISFQGSGEFRADLPERCRAIM